MLEPFHYAFVQRGLIEVVALSLGAGLIGTWIVLRGLPFYSHAVGAATFPGLVVADGLGFSALLGAFAAAGAFALAVAALARMRRSGHGEFTALVLVGALALGVILASNVFHSGANVETLLFGSLLLIGTRELVVAAAFSAVVLATTAVLGRRWLATGFDPGAARTIGARSPLPEAALLVLVAAGVVASIDALGALLVTALLVVPAATARLWTSKLGTWRAASTALVLVEGVAGLWISIKANVPPGAAIATLAGAVFAVAATVRALGARAALGAVAAIGAAALAGCGGSSTGSHGVSVVATTTQIADWARIVGGDAVSVHQILRPSTDPHEYEPRPADVIATTGARLVLENGDGLDAWMSNVVAQAGGNAAVVVLGDHVPVRHRGPEGAESSRFDPHWWHDPRNAASAVRQIRQALARAEPTHEALFARNATGYLAELADLDRTIARCLARVPGAERKLVTDHDALGYFAARYRLTVAGAVILSQTTQAQPSAGAMADLIALVRREHVRAIFPEFSLNRRLARAIARETGASVSHSLYADTLGPSGSSGDTYLRMELANADAIVRGLTDERQRCSPPAT